MAMRGGMLAALGLAVAGCNSRSSNPPASGGVTPPVATTDQCQFFGPNFCLDFKAAANSEPANVNDGDIIPISLAAEPININ